MDAFMNVMNDVNNILWHDNVLYFILGVGVLFTLWSGFCQYRALTHGVAVTRGKFDEHGDPGAINHFQALSTALSATVGLGNIAGVALAVSLGGPGAVFWMWVTGFIGMALKTFEVTQAMMYRNLDDPENPSGGAMWVVSRGLAKRGPGWAVIGKAVAVIFCITLLISAITGGNMFQAWNVADITFSYFHVPQIWTGVVLTILTGLVIVGGIKRIGNVTGRLVPVMCGLYLVAGLAVIFSEFAQIPGLLRLIVSEAFEPTQAAGAFVGGTAAFGFLKGMQRALFSNEAGQGSSPIAHSAARTKEPVREGVVAGLEPFIDTLVVCTITALVLLLSGAWNREPDLSFSDPPAVVRSAAADQPAGGEASWTLASSRMALGSDRDVPVGQQVYSVLAAHDNENHGNTNHKLPGTVAAVEGDYATIDWGTLESGVTPTVATAGAFLDYKGATLTAKSFDRVWDGLGYWMVPFVVWLFALSTIISWSYYGEQGVIYIAGRRWVMPYRIVYCLLVLVSATPLIRTQDELDIISTLGTGVMLFANIPIMLLFGAEAIRAYKGYFKRLDGGEFKPTGKH
ncbi:MAG: alanine/glycine:cation symporter family protein [Planctomycetota bacterium]